MSTPAMAVAIGRLSVFCCRDQPEFWPTPARLVERPSGHLPLETVPESVPGRAAESELILS